MPDPVTMSLLAQGGMGLISKLLGGRAQKREERRSDRRDALSNLQQSLGGSTMGRPTGLDRPRQPGMAEGLMGDPIVQQLIQQLIAGKGGGGGALWKLLGGGGSQAINQAARSMSGNTGVPGAGLNMGPGYQMNPRLKRGLGGR